MSDGIKISISEELMRRIEEEGVGAYPHECCGALLGRDGDGDARPREMVELIPFRNQREDSLRNRFSIDPEDVMRAEKQAQALGLDVVGWYHSHPDHPAKPSEYDREHAWPWYSYIIVSIEKGVAGEMNSWRLDEERGKYLQESVEIVSGLKARA
jgi:proteasome lid subunit RPN8/RPN11